MAKKRLNKKLVTILSLFGLFAFFGSLFMWTVCIICITRRHARSRLTYS